jgi:hypothetical protein
MTTETDVAPGADAPSFACVQDGYSLLAEFDRTAPSKLWPSVAQQLHEIERAVNAAHGGPLVTPTLPEVRRATWDEIRDRLRAEKELALAAPPAKPAGPAADRSGPLVLGPGRSAAQVFGALAPGESDADGVIEAELVEDPTES